MRGKNKYAFTAFMIKRVEYNVTRSCRIGDLFKTKTAAEQAIKATWAWRDGRFDEMEIYRQLVSKKRWEEIDPRNDSFEGKEVSL